MIANVLNQMTGDKTDIYLQFEGEWDTVATTAEVGTMVIVGMGNVKILTRPKPHSDTQVLKLQVHAVGTVEYPLNLIADWVTVHLPMFKLVLSDDLPKLVGELVWRFPDVPFSALTHWQFEEIHVDQIPTYELKFMRIIDKLEV